MNVLFQLAITGLLVTQCLSMVSRTVLLGKNAYSVVFVLFRYIKTQVLLSNSNAHDVTKF